jgi:hypothetical protein
MSRFVALCDASFCPAKRFAYLGYRIFPEIGLRSIPKPFVTSHIWFAHTPTCGQAEEFALCKLVNYLDQTEILKQTIIFCDRLPLIESTKRTGLNIRHIEGHKHRDRKNWIDWEFSYLDRELRKLLRHARGN